jgi:sugar phosphate isomerase/epimerase
MRNIALQLYTVRETMKNDFLGTLKDVAGIGYKGVELAGMGGMTAKELRAVLDDLGVTVVGGHCSVDAVNKGMEQLLSDYVTLGASYLGVAWVGEEWRSEQGWHRAARLMEKAAMEATKHDITFFYHNHAFEFEKINGKNGIDVLLESADPALVKWEEDVYWVKKGGEDPVAYMNKYAGRTPLVHIKDMTADPSHTFEIIGEGIIDFDVIFKAGDANKVDWYIVEQDQCPKGEIASARQSYQNIVARGWLNG